MCTLVLLRRPGHRWPVLIAANRDEMVDRPWDPPAAHWPDRPGVVAGRDRLAGGSWLGCNASGVVAAILNRTDSLGPAAGKRSRGELVLDALDYDDAGDAAAALAAIDPAAYRTFNLVIADNRDAYWLRSRDGRSPVEAAVMPAGLSMLTSANLNDTQNFRIAAYLPRFTEATPPDPDKGDWSSWRGILGSREAHPDAGMGDYFILSLRYPWNKTFRIKMLYLLLNPFHAIKIGLRNVIDLSFCGRAFANFIQGASSQDFISRCKTRRKYDLTLRQGPLHPTTPVRLAPLQLLQRLQSLQRDYSPTPDPQREAVQQRQPKLFAGVRW
jgi:hypothetical protein